MSIANDIANNVVSCIQAINGAATYANTIANTSSSFSSQVERVATHYSKIAADQFPHFCVLISQENRSAEPSHLKAEMMIQIQATFFKNTEAEISSWISDVEIALAQDIRRGNTGNVHESFIQSVAWDSGATEPYRIIKMELYVRYSYRFGHP